MPGGFVHITVAAEAVGRLDGVAGLSGADKIAVAQFMPFVEVGSVGPDYPYLGRQSEWADRMHYQATGEVICNGVRILRGYDPTPRRSRCLSWLLGFAAHVATDLTIHPVVQARVGSYADNKTAHRTCEMHQDAYIWPRRNLGELGLADYFRNNINHCSTEEGDLNSDLVDFWRESLQMTYPDYFVQDPPQLDNWNQGFKLIVDTIDDAGSFVSFTRHLLASVGAVYPRSDAVDSTFIENLETPDGRMHYDDIFARAVNSVVEVWSVIGEALHAATPEEAGDRLASIPNGNLDTGVSLGDGRTIYWRTA